MKSPKILRYQPPPANLWSTDYEPSMEPVRVEVVSLDCIAREIALQLDLVMDKVDSMMEDGFDRGQILGLLLVTNRDVYSHLYEMVHLVPRLHPRTQLRLADAVNSYNELLNDYEPQVSNVQLRSAMDEEARWAMHHLARTPDPQGRLRPRVEAWQQFHYIGFDVPAA